MEQLKEKLLIGLEVDLPINKEQHTKYYALDTENYYCYNSQEEPVLAKFDSNIGGIPSEVLNSLTKK